MFGCIFLAVRILCQKYGFTAHLIYVLHEHSAPEKNINYLSFDDLLREIVRLWNQFTPGTQKLLTLFFFWLLLKAVAGAVCFAVWIERRRLAALWQNSPIHKPRTIESPPVVDAPSLTPHDKTLGEVNVHLNP